MNVSELIAKLAILDPSMPVVTSDVWDDGVFKLVDVEDQDVKVVSATKSRDVYVREGGRGGATHSVLVISVI